MADIFVSYSRQDKGRVAPVVAALESVGWTIWWDPEITPGEEFDALISRELEAARTVVGLLVTLGEKDRAREWVLRGHLLDPGNLIMLYNFACAMVQLGDTDTAFELLPGFMAQMHAGLLRRLESDSDFDPIRGDPRFVTLLTDARRRLGVAA